MDEWWKEGEGEGGREGRKEGRTSGQMMVVMIEAGTTMPPMPSPARMRRPHARWRVSAWSEDRAAIPGISTSAESA